MENPLAEIENVVRLCVGLNDNPESQLVAIEQCATEHHAELEVDVPHRYYTRDAEFNHPLCKIGTAPGSREGILRIYQCVALPLLPSLAHSIVLKVVPHPFPQAFTHHQ